MEIIQRRKKNQVSNHSMKYIKFLNQNLYSVGCAPLCLTSEVMLNYISSSSSLNDCLDLTRPSIAAATEN